MTASPTAAPSPTALSADRSLELLAAEAALTVAALAGRLDEPIAYCPNWTGRDLATHLAGVYRWVAVIVGEGLDAPPDRDRRAALFADPDPTDDAGVLERLAAGAQTVGSALREAPEDLACWTIWGAEPGRAFWIRRQLHETVVHRVDAQNAGRTEPDVVGGADLDPALAADGVDEMMLGFTSRYAKLALPEPVTLALEATDAPHAWWGRIGPDAPAFGRGAPPEGATTTVRATAGELLLLVWNRREAAGLDVRGDGSVLDSWREKARL
ncbi:MAG: maleylpyruvate isomerase family mycothiol-dependent enzyme [Sporichthyaceae bacterium]